MFGKLFGKEPKKQGTGIWAIKESGFEQLDNVPGNGSINNVIFHLGFHLSQVYTVSTFDDPYIECLAVKVFTKEPIFVLTRDKTTHLSSGMLKNCIRAVDWDFEYSRHTIEDTLNEGIEAKDLSLEFLKSVLPLKQEGNSLYLAPSLQLYLDFKQGMLQSFASSEWMSADTKWLKDLNVPMFEAIKLEASKHQDSEIDTFEEVNMQCRALQHLPATMENEFIPNHKNAFGNVNFYNLLVAHHNEVVTIDEFRFVNKGRYSWVDENTLNVDRYNYHFSDSGNIVNVTKA